MSLTRRQSREAKIMLGETGTIRRVAALATLSKGDVDPSDWVVSALDSKGDGGIYLTIFSGPEAYERALEYASEKYSGLLRRGPHR